MAKAKPKAKAKAKAKPLTLSVVSALRVPGACVTTSVGKVGQEPVDVPEAEAENAFKLGLLKLADSKPATAPDTETG